MKKSQVLGLTAALAGSMAITVPQIASAAVTCSSTGSGATLVTTCSGSGGYTAENVSFTGSKGVSTSVSDNTDNFGACSYHASGTKSFGMSTGSTTMTIRNATGKTAVSGADGCGT